MEIMNLNIVSDVNSYSNNNVYKNDDNEIKGDLFEKLLNENATKVIEENTEIENIEESEINYELLIALLISVSKLEELEEIQLEEIKLEGINIENLNLKSLELENSLESLNFEMIKKLDDSIELNSESITLSDINNIEEMIEAMTTILEENEDLDKLIKSLNETKEDLVIDLDGIDEELINEIKSHINTDMDKFKDIELIAKSNYKEYNNFIEKIDENSLTSEFSINAIFNQNEIIDSFNNYENNDMSILENIIEEGVFSMNVNSFNQTQETEKVETPIPVIRQEALEEETIKTIRFMTKNGVEEISVKISPRELGDMTIRLVKESDISTVLIELTNEDAYELINRNLSELIKSLDDSKINIKDVVITINKNDKDLNEDNFNNHFNQSNNKKNNKRGITEEIEFEDNIVVEDDNFDILI
ncbi:MAG: flagellar hook-length control protein FliK [Peptostreptococcaceae bacterium]